MKLFDNIVAWWRKRQRAIDLQILWPACRARAVNLECARAAFIRHMAGDPAWADITEEELGEFVRTQLI